MLRKSFTVRLALIMSALAVVAVLAGGMPWGPG
jgi:hypothetical protein